MSAILSSLTMDDARQIVAAFLGLSATAYGINLLASVIFRRG